MTNMIEPTTAEIERAIRNLREGAQNYDRASQLFEAANVLENLAAILAMDRRAEVVGEPLAGKILDLMDLHGDDFHICERCGHQEDAAFKNADLFGFIKEAAEASRASPPAPAVAVPVAYQWRGQLWDGHWSPWQHGKGPDSGDSQWQAKEVRPLFAAAPEPPATRSEADIRNEGREDAARWHDEQAGEYRRLLSALSRGVVTDQVLHDPLVLEATRHRQSATAIRALKEPRDE
jgi:hypothetical protein